MSPGSGRSLPRTVITLGLEILLLTGALLLLLATDWPSSSVVIVVHPGNAVIRAGGERGSLVTSGSAVRLSPEGSLLSLHHRDYLRKDTLLVPGRSDTIVIDLDYSFPVIVTSEPAGARIAVDGDCTGTRTPDTVLAGSPGAHCFGVMLNGFVRRDTLNLLAHRPERVHLELPDAVSSPVKGMVYIPGGYLRRESAGTTIIDHVRGFYICDHEVTVSELCRFLEHVDPEGTAADSVDPGRTRTMERLMPCDFPPPIAHEDGRYRVCEPGGGSRPARGLSPEAALEYCAYLSEQLEDGSFFCLPTEMQWEYAALRGSGDAIPVDEDGRALANFSDVREPIRTMAPDVDDGAVRETSIGSYPPDRCGLYDMRGNLSEWCLDDSTDPYHACPSSAGLPESLSARGGSWLSAPSECRSSSRLVLSSSLGYAFTGFRVVWMPSSERSLDGDSM